MSWKEQVRSRFSQSKDANKWSAIYTAEYPDVDSLSFRQRRDYAVNYILENVSQSSKIVDIGCGAGPVLVSLSGYRYDLIGIDYSEDMLALAHENLGENAQRIPLMQGDCEDVQLPDNSVDCVVCLGVISYAESITGALTEIERLLKPGGKAIVSYRNALNEIFMDPIAWLKYPFVDHSATDKTIIGRSIPRTEVISCVEKTHLKLEREHQIGFGALRFNKKIISNGRLAIKVSRYVGSILSALGLRKLYRNMADVHIVILQKQIKM